MTWDWTTIVVLATLFLAALVRSVFGFGEALVAVPILALLMPVEVAVPIAALMSITIAIIVLAQDWRHVHLGSAGWLVLSSLVGIPLGLVMLKAVAEPVVKAILGILIIAFSLYSLASRGRYELKSDRMAWLFGFIAGVLGGAYSMSGPPVVLYGSLRHWSPERFRATLQGYFLPTGLMIMGGYWFTGLWTASVSGYYLMALPLIVAAIFLGRVINRRLHPRRFQLYVHVALTIIGIVLLAQAFRGRPTAQ